MGVGTNTLIVFVGIVVLTLDVASRVAAALWEAGGRAVRPLTP